MPAIATRGRERASLLGLAAMISALCALPLA